MLRGFGRLLDATLRLGIVCTVCHAAGAFEPRIRVSLLLLLRNQVAEWKAFNGRAALNRYLIAA